MFKLRQISKRYRTGDLETTALDQIGLAIEAGEYLAITGPSGCGKSTLLGILGLFVDALSFAAEAQYGPTAPTAGFRRSDFRACPASPGISDSAVDEDRCRA